MKHVYFFYCMILTAYGQDISTNKKAVHFYREGQKRIQYYDFKQGIAFFKKSIQADKTFVEPHLALASVYERLSMKENLLNEYKKCLQLDSSHKKNDRAYLFLAEFHFLIGEYEKTHSLLNKYSTIYPDGFQNNKKAKTILESCNFARHSIKNPVDVQIELLKFPLNTLARQYFPSFTADNTTLFFTGRIDAASDENIFYTQQDSSHNWSIPKEIEGSVNTPSGNEGICSVNADGTFIVFVGCQYPDRYGKCDLYTSKKKENGWEAPQNMGYPINTHYWESHPSLSADGRTLYFTSDREPKSKGKLDIWVSHQDENGYWSEPENVGDVINTSENDVSPFIHNNGQTLYWASDGHIGMGNLDIFKSEYDGEKWSPAQNIGYPFNNHQQQLSLSVSSDNYGYFTHSETNTWSIGDNGNEKIYSVKLPEAIKPQKKVDILKGNIFDAETLAPLSASIEIFDIQKNTILYKSISDKNGKYSAVLTAGKTYSLYVTCPYYIFQDTMLYSENTGVGMGFTINFYLQPIKIGSVKVLKNIFFEFNSDVIQEEAKTELLEVFHFLEKNTQVNIEIYGHTDNVGDTMYNQNLSLKRAKAVYNFLIKKNISQERLRYFGKGGSDPQMPNTTEEGRKQNRRIEFKIF